MTPALCEPGSRPDLIRAAEWLTRVGIHVHLVETWGDEIAGVDFDWGRAGAEPFNRGIWIANGEIAADEDLAHVGDLVHEAGHLAVLPPVYRTEVFGDVESVLEALLEGTTHPPETRMSQALANCSDQAVIAWAHAALRAIGLNPFYQMERGFPDLDDGEKDALMLQLERGQHPGVHELCASGMIDRLASFPRMTKWLQDVTE